MSPYPQSLKFLIVLGAATLATLSCFILMYLMIATELHDAPVPERARISTALALEQPSKEPEKPKRRRQERILPSELPATDEGIPIPRNDVTILAKAERPSFESAARDFSDDVEFELAPPSNHLAPVYIVQPVYPFKAVMKEIEGYVVVNFGVRPNGTVRNPVVVESSPGALFDDAALSAIDKFRFQPRTHLGDPLAVDDVRMRFVFKLGAAGGQTRISQSVAGNP